MFSDESIRLKWCLLMKIVLIYSLYAAQFCFRSFWKQTLILCLWLLLLRCAEPTSCLTHSIEECINAGPQSERFDLLIAHRAEGVVVKRAAAHYRLSSSFFWPARLTLSCSPIMQDAWLDLEQSRRPTAALTWPDCLDFLPTPPLPLLPRLLLHCWSWESWVRPVHPSCTPAVVLPSRLHLSYEIQWK